MVPSVLKALLYNVSNSQCCELQFSELQYIMYTVYIKDFILRYCYTYLINLLDFLYLIT